MNQEWVEVVEQAEGGLWVEAVQRSACSRCSARAGCGQNALSQLGKPVRLWVPTGQRYAPGQQIMLGLPHGGLALSAVLIYGAPLLALLAGAILGQWLGGDLMALLAGVSALAAGLLIGRKLTDRYRVLWQPIILSQTQPLTVPGCAQGDH